MLVRDIVGERFSGQLVRLRGRLSVRYDLMIADDSGELLFYLRDKFFTNPKFADELIEGRAVEVVGIAEQYDSRAPFSTGYRVLPRDAADLQFAPLPPSRVAIVLSVALALSAMGLLTLWTSNARRRARELEATLAERHAVFESQRRFVADAGHEIRTPITVLRGEIEIALLRDRTPVEYRTVLRRAISDLGRVSRLADDLLTLARVSSGELATHRAAIDVEALLDGVREAYDAAAAKADACIRLEVETGLVLEADPVLVDRAVSNLVDNAIKYAACGGVITLAAATKDDGTVEIKVADRGPGILVTDRTRLFDRFYRGQASRTLTSGSGLGLAVVRSVMERHEGWATLDNGPDPGASFSLTFPAGHGVS